MDGIVDGIVSIGGGDGIVGGVVEGGGAAANGGAHDEVCCQMFLSDTCFG